MKVCKKCNQLLYLENYNKNKSKKDGLDIYCKSCVIEKSKKYRTLKSKIVLSSQNNKICTICTLEKPKSEFCKMKSQSDGLNYWCKSCTKEKTKSRDWYKNQYSSKKKKWNQQKYNLDLNYKLKSNLRCRINSILQKQKTYKNNNTLKYLGCSLEFYKQYLEQQFQPDMTWENHGILWEIDHIKPCASFNLVLEENIYKCFNYINTQPLYKSHNRSKKDKILT
jgi:hypothetical protein